MNLVPKNWGAFQHYKNRSPAWIKLHRGLLDDYQFSRLPLASKALAPLLWLLASEFEGGKITCLPEEMAFRFRMPEPDLLEAIKPLIDSGFFIDASNTLAGRYQSACLEERRGEVEKEKITRPEDSDDPDFSIWYSTYPRREARGSAMKAYRTARKTAEAETLQKAAELAKVFYAHTERKFIPLPATWLNAQRWLDEPDKSNGRASSNTGII